MSKLSIIVPIYNVEKYLLRCLDSIAAQTCRAFEAILIDDGSPDGCGRICDEYAAKDPRFTVIHQENRGVSAARNAGLRAAKGEYVGFVDPDDFIDPGMFAALLEAGAQTGAEIVCCNWETVHDDGRTCVHRLGRALPAQMPAEEFARHVFDVPRSIGGAVWNKLFRREILREPFQPDVTVCEDCLFLIGNLRGAGQAAFIDAPLYKYCARADSITRLDPGKPALGLPVRRRLIALAEPMGPRAAQAAEKAYLDSCRVILRSLPRERAPEAVLLAKTEYGTYLRAHLRDILANGEIGWKNKLIYFRDRFRRMGQRRG